MHNHEAWWWKHYDKRQMRPTTFANEDPKHLSQTDDLFLPTHKDSCDKGLNGILCSWIKKWDS